ncbi:hypothetical protein BABINDRAFT_176077 [Babjeviella inositovora NRRL Y-12698]|uniref:Large ribosomal subunit protein uL23 n=1 Tax=Babjeviella inositovora NRRL Y-12698 TaxID=984486 RepID=A0A1E3QSC0_9ASCO|nr:uncharacterized protein BABINDRAFT_176077 [Babjeviella inositovora NRRL Y-12698]ODQ79922.1 hypothetical protein BABINDRAFT_176077 [Babjeviella inositovora NRRL Y-12698]
MAPQSFADFENGKMGENCRFGLRTNRRDQPKLQATAKATAAKKSALKGANASKSIKVRTSTTFRLPKTLKLTRAPKYARKAVPHANRLDAYKVIVAPIASETAIKKVEDGNTLVFQVDLKSNKQQIKQAVKELYEVEALYVNTLIRPNGTKKAYVRLTADYDALDIANKIGYI